MMSSADASYPQWKAPVEDGELLIWPDRPALERQTRENQRLLSSAEAVRLQNVPLPEVRQAQRQWIGHPDAERPLIANGHQIELYHPGVWAKDLFINELASKLEGAAYHFAMDTDAPKHLYVRWPGGMAPITDDARMAGADWAGLLEASSPRHLKQVQAKFSEASQHWPFRPLLPNLLESMRSLALESSNLTWVLTNGIHQLDWQLGLRHHALLVSPVLLSPGYLLLVHHVLAQAGPFVGEYNAILEEHRRQQGISNPGRPWPNLRCTEGGCEVPFWCDDLENGTRERASVVRQGEGWALQAGGERFVFDRQAEGWEAAGALGRFLSRHGLRLAPRAVTLTTFFRLLLADQFVHGIGGGLYDQVTDRWIARCFGLRPPAFSVTTATLRFPTAAGQSRVALEPLRQEGRRIRHAWAEAQKRQLARQIAGLPRHSEQRRQLFERMHAQLEAIQHGPAYQAWRRRLEEARRLADEQRATFDRELFFAIQPEDRLQWLFSRYREWFE